MPSPIKTISLSSPHTKSSVQVALGCSSLKWVLIKQSDPTEEYDDRLWAVLSVIVPEDPFPGYGAGGMPMIWVSWS